MNTKEQRQSRICECGATFKTSAKFGNETKCDACYENRVRKFYVWFAQQPPEVRREVTGRLQQTLAELVAKDAEAAEKQEQDRIDTIAVTLLAELDI